MNEKAGPGGNEEAALRRIKESVRKYDRREQRAELLLRNEYFLRDWQATREGRPEVLARALKNDRGRVGRQLIHSVFRAAYMGKVSPAKEEQLHRFVHGELKVSIYNLPAQALCRKWGILANWDLTEKSLADYIDPSPPLIFHPSVSYPGMPGESIHPADFPEYAEKAGYLYVEIQPWTTREDLVAAWDKIRKIRKTIFGSVDKDKRNFGDALCWYDLHKGLRMSYLEIARLWIRERAPLIREEQAFRLRVREGIRRIETYIERLTPVADLEQAPQK